MCTGVGLTALDAAVTQAETMSPCPFEPRMAFGTGRRVRPLRSRQTLVFHSRPSTVATTDFRPHASVVVGAYSSGTVAKVHPPFPGI